MVRHVRPHRADDATIVDDLCDIRERLVDIDPALAAFAEAERRGHEPAVFLRSVKFPLRFLPFMFLQSRFGIEGIDVRRAAIHEQEDDAFGARGEVRCARAACRKEHLRAKQSSHADETEAGAGALKHCAAGQ